MTTATEPLRTRPRPMTHNTDPRAVRTRRKLVAAFHDAVRDTDVAELSVSALTRAAGVNRTSFYTHFASPEDLAVHALGDLFEAVARDDVVLRADRGVPAAESSRRALARVVTFIDTERATYARLLGPTAPAGVTAAIHDAFVDWSVRALDQAGSRPAGVDPVATAHFLAGGVLGVLGLWLHDTRTAHPGPDVVVENLVRCLPAWLTTDPPNA